FARPITPVPAVHLARDRHSLSRSLARLVPAAEGAVNPVVLVGVIRLLRSVRAPPQNRPLAPPLQIARRELPSVVVRDPARFSRDARRALGSGRHLPTLCTQPSLQQVGPSGSNEVVSLCAVSVGDYLTGHSG